MGFSIKTVGLKTLSEGVLGGWNTRGDILEMIF
jgi:hypothetical protein